MKLALLLMTLFSVNTSIAINKSCTSGICSDAQHPSAAIELEKRLCQEYVYLYEKAEQDIRNNQIQFKNLLNSKMLARLDDGIRREVKNVESKIITYFEEFSALPFLDPFKITVLENMNKTNATLAQNTDKVKSEIFSNLYSFNFNDSKNLDLFQQQIFRDKSTNHKGVVISNMRDTNIITVDGKEQHSNIVKNDTGQFYRIRVKGFESDRYYSINSFKEKDLNIYSNGFSLDLVFTADIEFSHRMKSNKYYKSELDQLTGHQLHDIAQSKTKSSELIQLIPQLKAPFISTNLRRSTSIRFKVNFEVISGELITQVSSNHLSGITPLDYSDSREQIKFVKDTFDLLPTEYLQNWLENYLDDNNFTDLYNQCI